VPVQSQSFQVRRASFSMDASIAGVWAGVQRNSEEWGRLPYLCKFRGVEMTAAWGAETDRFGTEQGVKVPEKLFQNSLALPAAQRYNIAMVGWGYFLSSLPPRPPAHFLLWTREAVVFPVEIFRRVWRHRRGEQVVLAYNEER
jgi:hypothetical protein